MFVRKEVILGKYAIVSGMIQLVWNTVSQKLYNITMQLKTLIISDLKKSEPDRMCSKWIKDKLQINAVFHRNHPNEYNKPTTK